MRGACSMPTASAHRTLCRAQRHLRAPYSCNSMDDPVHEINQRFCQRRVCMIWKNLTRAHQGLAASLKDDVGHPAVAPADEDCGVNLLSLRTSCNTSMLRR